MTNMSRCKKSIKDPIVDLKKRPNKAKIDKMNLLLADEDEDNSLLYQFCKYNENKHSSNKKGYLSYQKLSRLNTKIRKLSNNLKDTYGITVGTNHLKCAEPPDPIVKCADCNRRPILHFTSVYQMQLCTGISYFIVVRRPF